MCILFALHARIVETGTSPGLGASPDPALRTTSRGVICNHGFDTNLGLHLELDKEVKFCAYPGHAGNPQR